MASRSPVDSPSPSQDERLSRIGDHLTVGFSEIAKDGALTFASARWREIVGMDCEDRKGAMWFDAVHPDDAASLTSSWAAAAAQARPLDCTARFISRVRIATVRVSLQPVIEHDGLRGFVGTAIDVSDFAHLSEALAQSREQFRVLAESMPQLVWSTAQDGAIEYFNRRWLDYTGLSVQNFAQHGAKGTVHPDDVALAVDRWTAALASGAPYEMEYRLRNAADGSYRWFIARAAAARDETGAIVRWIGTATDIDAQKRANDNLRFVLETSATLSSSLDVQTICDKLANTAVHRVADWCIIALTDEHGCARVASVRHRDPSMLSSVQRSSNGTAIREGSQFDIAMQRNVPILIPKVTPEQLHESSENPAQLRILEHLRFNSAIIAPISTESGQVYGGLALASSESFRTFNESDVEVVEMVARRAATAIHNAQVFDHERRTSARLRFIARASELVFESLDIETVFDRVTQFVVSEMADFAAVLLIDGNDAVRIACASARDARKNRIAERFRGQRIWHPQGEERVIAMLSQRRTVLGPIVNPDAVEKTIWEYAAPDVRALGLQSSVTVPLYSRGETYGALIASWAESDRRYEESDVPVFGDLGRRLSVAIDHARTLERERRISTALQRTLLPQVGMLPSEPGLRFEAEYRASSSEADVGGDWYDAVTLPDGSIAISVGDVTGRGLSAAGLMGQIRQAVSVAALYESDPARILDAVDFFMRSRGSTAIATAFIGILDPSRRTIRYASAGHPPPLLRCNGQLIELRSSGLPLGLRADDIEEERTREASLEGAELLVLYTDGLTEATHDLEFGERRLRQVVATQAALFVRNAARFICDACLPFEAHDDTAVMTLSFGERTHWAFDAENARAAHDVRYEFVRHLRDNATPGSDFQAAELIFGELIGNVVRHAPGPIDVQVEWHAENPILHVIDRGKGFIRDPKLPPDPLSESGRGLYIIDQFARAAVVERIPGYGNHVAAELRISRRASRDSE